MGKRTEAPITPEVARWARESIGLTVPVVADLTGFAAEDIVAWEEGRSLPTLTQLRRLGQMYRRPIAVFFLPKAPKDFSVLHDFRRPPDADRQVSPELAMEIHRAQQRRWAGLELIAGLGLEVRRGWPQARHDANIETIAEAIRNALTVHQMARSAWRNEYDAYNAWRRAVERTGVLVFQTGKVPAGEMRAFSLSGDKLPVIVVNTRDAPRGRIFSLLHEYAHLTLRTDGICDFAERRGAEAVEVLCNAVAAEVLVPAKEFLREPEIARVKGATDSWADAELEALARRYQVSREVIARRLLTLGKTTQRYYEKKREEYVRWIEARREETEGFVPPPQQAIANLGRAYTRLVLDAYAKEVIGPSEFYDFMGLKARHLPKVQEILLGRGGDST